MNKLTDARLIDLARHARTAGEVIVAEAAAQVPFRIERIFTLTAPAGAVRGRHAHRLCSQFMICVSGAVDVVCEDGNSKKTFAMNRCSDEFTLPISLTSRTAVCLIEISLVSEIPSYCFAAPSPALIAPAAWRYSLQSFAPHPR